MCILYFLMLATSLSHLILLELISLILDEELKIRILLIMYISPLS